MLRERGFDRHHRFTSNEIDIVDTLAMVAISSPDITAGISAVPRPF
jgi:hypothetical protein